MVCCASSFLNPSTVAVAWRQIPKNWFLAIGSSDLRALVQEGIVFSFSLQYLHFHCFRFSVLSFPFHSSVQASGRARCTFVFHFLQATQDNLHRDLIVVVVEQRPRDRFDR